MIQKLLSVLLLFALLFSTTFITPTVTSATETHSWNTTLDFEDGTYANTTSIFPGEISLGLQGTLTTDSTSEDFALGGALANTHPSHAVHEDGSLSLGHSWGYATTSTPAIGGNDLWYFDLRDNLIYASTTAGGLSVIDTQGTPDPSDDELVFTYSTTSTPAIGHDYVYHSNLSGDLLYVGTRAGLDVIDTKGTIDPSDDEHLIRYDNSSVAPIGSGTRVTNSHVSGNLLYVSTNYGGLHVIDTKGTVDPADDELLIRYNTGSMPPISNIRAYKSFLSGNLLYVSTSGGGVSVIDTKGTQTIGDDELVFTYSTTSEPAIAHDESIYSHLSGNLLYVSTSGGLTVIDTKGTQSPNDDELVFTYSTTSEPAIAGVGVRHSHLSGNLLYVSTSGGLTVIDTKGTLDPSDDEIVTNYATTTTSAIGSNNVYYSRLADNLLYVATQSGGGLSVIDLTSEHHAPSTSYVSKAHPINTPLTLLLADVTTPTGTSVTMRYRTGDEFAWNPWSETCADTKSCAIEEVDLIDADLIQYRLDLVTTDSLITPSVNFVSLSEGFEETGTYTSEALTFAKSNDLLSFTADTLVPEGTTLAFEYSLNGGDSWLPIVPGNSFPSSTKATSFTWRATFTTADPSLSPTIHGIELTSTPSTARRSTTSVALQVGNLVAQGKHEEAAALEDRFVELDTEQLNEITIRQEIVRLMLQIIALLERVVEMQNKVE